MIRTNSKKAIENIRKYIIENYNADGYDEDDREAQAQTFEEIAEVLLLDVKRVYGHEVKRCFRMSWQDAFEKWASGLPGLLDTCYYYNRSAKDDLGAILEETEEEKDKYTEAQAEQMLTRLIYRELYKVSGSVL